MIKLGSLIKTVCTTYGTIQKNSTKFIKIDAGSIGTIKHYIQDKDDGTFYYYVVFPTLSGGKLHTKLAQSTFTLSE